MERQAIDPVDVDQADTPLMRECPDCEGSGRGCRECIEGRVAADTHEYLGHGEYKDEIADAVCPFCHGKWQCETCNGEGEIPDDELPAHFQAALDRRVQYLDRRYASAQRTRWLEPILDTFINGWLEPWEIGWSLSLEDYNAMPVTLHVTVESLRLAKPALWIKSLVDAGMKIDSAGETVTEYSNSLYWHLSCRENPELPALGLRISGKSCVRVKIGTEVKDIFETRCE